MSDLEELKGKFLVSDSLSETKMLALLQLAVDQCAVDKTGNVEIKNTSLAAKEKVMLVLSARFLAHELDESISPDVTAEELARNTAIEKVQVRARASDLAKERQIEVMDRGVYRALLHKIEPFLRSLTG
jgi:hypothetical protein